MKSGYEGLEARWHDLFWEAEEAASELPLLEDFLGETQGRALYLGSGSGRLLGPLVEGGHELVGLEISDEMRELSQERFPKAEVIAGSWQEHAGRYEAIVIPAFTFQLFGDPQRQLQRLREQTSRLYLTLFFPWAELSGDLPSRKWYFDRSIILPTGETGELQSQHKINERSGSLVRKHRYVMKGKDGEVLKTQETVQKMRFFSDRALKKLFQSGGWSIDKEINNLGEGEENDLVYVATFHLRGQ